MANTISTSDTFENHTLSLSAPNGWNQWVYAKTTVKDPENNIVIQLPDARFPPLYTPSKSFWLRSIIDNCLIYWINTLDLFSAALISGLGSGTLTGSLGALSTVQELLNVKDSQVFGIGKSAAAPQMGYCLGSAFKQHVYTTMVIINNRGFQPIATDIYIQLLQNYKFKRIYVNHGQVVKYQYINAQHILTLDINQDTSYVKVAPDTTIKIVKKDGKTVTLHVNGIRENWDLVIGDPGTFNIESGDFYIMSKFWCIEDPFLLSGWWRGPENGWAVKNGRNVSGKNLYVTTHISPYEKGQINGVYIWKKIQESTNTTTTLPSESTETTNTSTTTLLSQQNPQAGTSMLDVNGYEWAFLSFGNKSKIYPGKNRFKDIISDIPESDGSVINFGVRGTAYYPEYVAWRKDIENTYVRIELDIGNYEYRHNWHAPCLVGSYLINNGSYFRIVGHVEANIIDVELTSVDGIVFDPAGIQTYEIINQYGWFINEHYDGYTGQKYQSVFKGSAVTYSSDSNSTNINFEVKKDSPALWYIDNAYVPPDIKNNFVSRYRKTHDHTQSEPNKMYKKFQDWKFVSDNGGASNDILDIVFTNNSPQKNGESYMIKLEVNGVLDFSSNNDGYVTFDSSYQTVSPFSKESGYSYTVSIAGGVTKKDVNIMIASDLLCLNGEYISNPYFVDIPVGSRIGCCGGLYFGLDANGSAQDSNGLFLLISTLRSARGIASLFHSLRQEDWVVYRDLVTKKLTVRRGSLNFKEYPMKSEIVIGELPPSEDATAGSVISLNTEKERLRRLIVGVQDMEAGQNPSIMFGIGSEDNVYGFRVSGDGIVDLQTYRKQGIVVESNANTDIDGNKVSPVYLYKRSEYQNLTKLEIDIGVNTKEYSKIYVKNGEVNSAIAFYTDEKNTIEDADIYDIIRCEDGEIFLVYGKKIGEFVVNGKLNNSGSNSWVNKGVVMILGTFNDTFVWKCPHSATKNEEKYNYPIMVMNSVDYLGSIYNKLNNTIVIFARCYDKNNKTFVGCYPISILDILHKNIFECQDPEQNENSPLNFLWRPPLIEDSNINNKDYFWTYGNQIVDDGYSFNMETEKTNSDSFYRSVGSGSSGCSYVYTGEVGIPSFSILQDGSYMMLYDTDVGVKAVYSNDCGQTWAGSNVIYAKNAKSAIVIGTYLFYITESGIEIKQTQMSDFSGDRTIAYKNKEGVPSTEIEINMQKQFDETNHFLIGSGIVSSQRLSGYISNEGIIKIFYYNNEGLLMAMESNDSNRWKVSDNF